MSKTNNKFKIGDKVKIVVCADGGNYHSGKKAKIIRRIKTDSGFSARWETILEDGRTCYAYSVKIIRKKYTHSKEYLEKRAKKEDVFDARKELIKNFKKYIKDIDDNPFIPEYPSAWLPGNSKLEKKQSLLLKNNELLLLLNQPTPPKQEYKEIKNKKTLWMAVSWNNDPATLSWQVEVDLNKTFRFVELSNGRIGFTQVINKSNK